METTKGSSLCEILDLDLEYIYKHRHNYKHGDYVLAIYYPKEDNADNFAFRCKVSFFKNMLLLLKKNDYQAHTGKPAPNEYEPLWIRITKRGFNRVDGLYLCQGEIADSNWGNEYSHFTQAYRVGEYITCPIKLTDEADIVAVGISPSIWIQLENRELAKNLREAIAYANTEYVFRIVQIEYDRTIRKLEIELKHVPLPKMLGVTKLNLQKAKSVLPESPNEVFVSKPIIKTLNAPKNHHVRNEMQRELGIPLSDTITVQEIANFCKIKYCEEYNKNHIFARKYGYTTEGSFQLGIKDENNVPLNCGFTLKKDKPNIIVFAIGLFFHELAFDRFVSHGYWAPLLNNLCNKIGIDFFSLSNDKKNAMIYILRMYFYRAYEEGKLLINENGAAFACGFSDQNGAPLYCYMENLDENTESVAWLKYKCFLSGSDKEDVDFLKDKFHTLPQIPKYMSKCQPADFEYDPSFFVSIDADNFVKNEMKRFGSPITRAYAFKYPQTFCKRLKEQILTKIEEYTNGTEASITPCYYEKTDGVAWLVLISFENEYKYVALYKTSEDCYSAVALYDAPKACQRTELFASAKRLQNAE